MKLTFLGTGTSTGVPQMRCGCEVCVSSDSRDKRLRASALLEIADGAPKILIDCGPDFRQQMLRLNSPDLAALLVTHTHYDHLGGVDDLRPYAHAMPDAKFPIYCRGDVARDLRARVPYCFVEHPYPGVPSFDINIIREYEPFYVELGGGYGSVEVLPVPVMHAKLPILGFRFGALAYITDCKTITAEAIAALQGVDCLVINALRDEEHMSHLNLRQALDVIFTVAPRKAFLTHMSHQIGLHARVEKELPDGVTLAHDGLSVELP